MRIRVLVSVAMAVALAGLVGRAQVAAPYNSKRAPQSVAEFEKWQKEVSNWGRWGKDDEIGLMNLVTDAKRKEATKLVKTGHAISLAHNLITEKAPDMPNPFEMTSGGSTFKIGFHSTTHSHVDAICQFDYQGQLYNGLKISEVKPPTAVRSKAWRRSRSASRRAESWTTSRDSRACRIWNRGRRSTPRISRWEKQAGVKAGPGDAIFLRTGRWARREGGSLGPHSDTAARAGGRSRLPRFHVPWMHKRDVMAVAATRRMYNVRPSGVSQEVIDRVRAMPVHSLFIVSMGGFIIDATDLEELADYALKNRSGGSSSSLAPDWRRQAAPDRR